MIPLAEQEVAGIRERLALILRYETVGQTHAQTRGGIYKLGRT
jgi:hypothetical protein